ncbi:MAG: hypothetical protein QM606_03535 [Leucobacter sp.]
MSLSTERSRRPWHLWLVVVVATLFMSVGLYDFVMVAAQDQAYLTSRYTPEGVAYFSDYPWYLLALFGINVIGVMLALIVSLWSRRAAMRLALVSAVADVVLLVITILFRDRFEAIGIGLTVQDIAICLGIVLLAWYFHRLSRRETLQGA